MTVKALRTVLEKKYGDIERIIFSGMDLNTEDNLLKTLADVNIGEKSTINLVFRVRGGAVHI
jgi:hypothetical protein